MKVAIDLENLESLVSTVINGNIESVIKEQIDLSIKEEVRKQSKKIIESTVSDNFERFVNEYISNTVIKTGGGYFDEKESKEYTVEQYIKQELKSRLESNSLKIKKVGKISSYSDDFEKVSFEEYIARKFDFNEMITKEIDKFMDEIRKDINKTMKESFDNSTKTMLSNSVLNILSCNETYQKIENNIKSIADKKG